MHMWHGKNIHDALKLSNLSHIDYSTFSNTEYYILNMWDPQKICRKLHLTVLKAEKLETKVNKAKLVTQSDGNRVSRSAKSSFF